MHGWATNTSFLKGTFFQNSDHKPLNALVSLFWGEFYSEDLDILGGAVLDLTHLLSRALERMLIEGPLFEIHSIHEWWWVVVFWI